MDLADRAQDTLEEALNAEGRPPSHVTLGILIALGAVGATAVIAGLRPQPAKPGEPPQPRGSVWRVLWPTLFSVTTLAAIRVWNAPPSPERTRALSLWGGLQAVNAFWMFLRPKSRELQLASALSTAAVTGLYARSAGEVDAKAGTMAAPAGWASLAGVFSRKSPPAGDRTLH